MANIMRRPFGFVSESPIDLYDHMFDEFFRPSRAAGQESFKVDISESETGYLVEADMPGVKKENLDVEMNEDKLIITVAYDQEVDDSDDVKNYIHRERRHFSMKRACFLKDSDAENITAKLEDGVLTINVPKRAPQANVKKIALQ